MAVFSKKLSSTTSFDCRWYFIGFLLITMILSACGDDESSAAAAASEEKSALPSYESDSNNLSNSYSIYWVGSFPSAEYISNPEYLWVFYNTTNGCSYIYTQSGWNLFAGQGCDGRGTSTSDVGAETNPAQTDPAQSVVPGTTDIIYGNDGKNGVDGKDGKDGRDGVDGKDGKDGLNGRDGVDGKDGKDGRDGVDGKDGEGSFVFVKSEEEEEDGITYDVKSYAQLEAGNPYFYSYYKFYFVEDFLAKTYVCYHTVANLNSVKISYLDFSEEDCREAAYIKTYSSDGYVLSSVQQMYSQTMDVKSVYIYYPSSTVVHYLAQYQGGKLVTAVEYSRGGSAISTNSADVMNAIENQFGSGTSVSVSSDSTPSFAVKSISLNRYHILNTDENRDVATTIVVNDLSLVDTTGGVYVQVINSTLDTVFNFRANSILNDTIKAVVKAPAFTGISYYGNTYSVYLKTGGNVYKNWSRKFNVSGSYFIYAFTASSSTDLSVNIDNPDTDSLSIPIMGFNLDFVKSMCVKVFDNALIQIDSVAVDLTPTQWLSDGGSNYQTVYGKILTPQKEGTYYLELYVNGEKYNSTKNYSLIVYKKPYFTSFEIPGASIDDALSYVNATIKGKNFKKSSLDLTLFDLKFSKDYELIESLKYEATIVNDSLMTLKIFIPSKSGEYKISAYYDKEQIDSKFTVIGSCSAKQEKVIVQLDDSYKICKSGSWVDATPLERDVYQKTCSEDGSIESGNVTSSNKYVCDADTFRVANELEIKIGIGCVSYNDGKIILYEKESLSLKSDYVCEDGSWQYSRVFNYGTLIDERDEQSYKTILIGGKTWMAENLNYADSVHYPSMLKRNWCYGNSSDNCDKYGRLYTWAAAMDSVGTLSVDGKGCGDYTKCRKESAKITVQGICPDGWHLPDKDEWSELIDSVGGSSVAGLALKSEADWNGSDTYGFSAVPAGYKYSTKSFSGSGSSAFIWSSTENDATYAAYVYLNSNSKATVIESSYKSYGRSVRCVKNEDVE